MPQTNKYAFSGQKSGGRGLGTASAAEKARDGIPYRFPKSGFSPILAGIGAGVFHRNIGDLPRLHFLLPVGLRVFLHAFGGGTAASSLSRRLVSLMTWLSSASLRLFSLLSSVRRTRLEMSSPTTATTAAAVSSVRAVLRND